MKRALLAAALLLSSPAAAETGNELQETCKTNRNYCHGYIDGAADMFIFQMAVGPAPLCIGDGVTYGQLGDVVLHYIKTHPETRHQPAIGLIISAIREAFDCPR